MTLCRITLYSSYNGRLGVMWQTPESICLLDLLACSIQKFAKKLEYVVGTNGYSEGFPQIYIYEVIELSQTSV